MWGNKTKEKMTSVKSTDLCEDSRGKVGIPLVFGLTGGYHQTYKSSANYKKRSAAGFDWIETRYQLLTLAKLNSPVLLWKEQICPEFFTYIPTWRINQKGVKILHTSLNLYSALSSLQLIFKQNFLLVFYLEFLTCCRQTNTNNFGMLVFMCFDENKQTIQFEIDKKSSSKIKFVN